MEHPLAILLYLRQYTTTSNLQNDCYWWHLHICTHYKYLTMPHSLKHWGCMYIAQIYIWFRSSLSTNNSKWIEAAIWEQVFAKTKQLLQQHTEKAANLAGSCRQIYGDTFHVICLAVDPLSVFSGYMWSIIQIPLSCVTGIWTIVRQIDTVPVR